MATYYIWFKALHIAFMVTWFAGLFYLPRLFIYHAQASDATSRERFTVMEKRLFIITSIGATLTCSFGLALAFSNPALFADRWLQVKLVLVIGLVVFQFRCWLWILRLQTASHTQETGWLRWFNEIPTACLLIIVILAVVRP